MVWGGGGRGLLLVNRRMRLIFAVAHSDLVGEFKLGETRIMRCHCPVLEGLEGCLGDSLDVPFAAVQCEQLRSEMGLVLGNKVG